MERVERLTVVINNDSKVESVTISSGGSGYTFGTVDLEAGGVPTGATKPVFNVIIPPNGGHGYDIYRELESFHSVLSYDLRMTPKIPILSLETSFSRVGLVENPTTCQL